ncbi:MAG: MmcQ/YjbR family DNA-binding protein [Clostridia bacterium]|nr:MmcQ/YjbR family DNA-binding protein [Clostridia bacterium]
MKYPWIDAYLKQKQGVTSDFKAEWGWQRYLLGDKMFAAICMNEAGQPYYITLKLEPTEGEFLRGQYPDILPGYYMNKLHWNSIRPDGEVPDALVRTMLDKSYELVFKSLPKKKQAELLAK